jgi:hypothetical protein
MLCFLKKNEMAFSIVLNEINWFSVVLATVLAFVTGGLWYSPLLFGNQWAREVGNSDEKIKNSNKALIFSLAFILNFVSAFFLDIFIGPISDAIGGFTIGLTVSLAFICAALGTNYLFALRSFRLFLIDAGYFVLYFSVMGIILGAL